MDKINKYLPLLGWLSVVSAIIGGIYFFGGFMTEMTNGVLTPEQKVKIIKHEETAPNDVDSYLMFRKMDSVMGAEQKNSDDAVRSRARRDSIIQHALEISNRNAVQIYQMKEQNDTIIKLLKQQ